jgi:integrase
MTDIKDVIEDEVVIVIKNVIEPSTLKNYIYKNPLFSINEHGEVISTYRKGVNGVLIKKITFLNKVGYDLKGRMHSFEPVDVANSYILSKHLDDDVLDSGLTSQALLHYFAFVIDHQTAWDAEYDEDTFNELYDEPRPDWNYFPKRKAEKLTYLYRAGLKTLVIVDGVLAKSTAKSYMSAVVKFYKYWLRKGYQFNHPPFEHEIIELRFEAGASSMKSYMRKEIHTTDLRIKFAKPSRSGGTALNNLRRDLKPFTDSEWKILQNILVLSRRVIRNNDTSKMHSLPIEFCLHPMICRYSAMRREEAASLHLGQIVNPELIINEAGEEVFKSPVLNIGIGDKYGSLTKDKEVGNKSRVTIIPASLMKQLYDYTQSERYTKRLAKYKVWCKEQMENGNTSLFEGDDAVRADTDYLFITQKGKPMMMRVEDFTGRWVEVRNTANHSQALTHKILGSLHNLRATFAVNIFRHLLKKMDPDTALDRVSSLLGHEDRATTLEYLKIAQDMPMADEIYEDVLDFIGAFDDVEVSSYGA